MSRIFHDIKIGLDEDLEEKLEWLVPHFSRYHILRQSVDARRRHSPHLVYSLEVFGPEETPPPAEAFDLDRVTYQGEPVLVVGSGPAGLFAGLRLLERGIPCEIFERGSDCVTRLKAINRFWRYGQLDTRNNVCFGEGGAGLYSDGKLITRIKSPHIPYVMRRLVDFGAPPEIIYQSNPHVGSDRIRRLIPRLRERLLSLGGKIHFDTQVTQLLTQGKQVIGLATEQGQEFRGAAVVLATGHSAEDVFHHLAALGVTMEGKSFAVGLRIEHPQQVINQTQFREFADHPKLGAANYRLTAHNDQTQVGVYSFCMCPGGYVLSSGTEADGLVSNGMSNFSRNSAYANAAIVVSVDHDKSFGAKNTFGGLKWRREIETRAFAAVQAAGGTKELPVQKLTDFLARRAGEALPGSCPSGMKALRLDSLLPTSLFEPLCWGLERFNQSFKGFISSQAQFFGVETRTSCPVRVVRHDETLESVSHSGLFPCGEGAGYAGGITSAAVDGIKVAEAITTRLAAQHLSNP